ncbi:hypothetical protein D3C80_205520 [compost metagenome]
MASFLAVCALRDAVFWHRAVSAVNGATWRRIPTGCCKLPLTLLSRQGWKPAGPLLGPGRDSLLALCAA